MNPVHCPIKSCTVSAIALIAVGFIADPAHADTSYTTSDGTFSFHYPQRWQVTEAGEKIQITSSDGSAYILQRDALQTLPTQSPVNDAGLKSSAAHLVAPLLKAATFVRASSISMDHGLGASFRFRTATDTTADVWIGIIGKHSVVLLPEKTGQPSQTIGLSVIFQSMAFADALPKAPLPRPSQPMNATPTAGSSSVSGSTTSGTRTVFYSKQIAPILKDRCAACHSGGGASGGFDVSNYNTVMSGGVHGALVRSGRPTASKLIDYLTGVRDQMPKGSAPLSSDQIDLFRRWIAEGATNDLAPAGSTPTLGQNNAVTSGSASRNTSNKNSSNTTQTASTATRGVRGGDRNLLERYAGHLAANDTSFKLRINVDGTATADWVFNLTSQAHYEGTYTSSNAGYVLQLKQTSGSVPDGSKSLVIVMQDSGITATGKFGTDTTNPRLQIASLEMTEIGNAGKSTPAVAGGTATTRATQQKKQQKKQQRKKPSYWIPVP